MASYGVRSKYAQHDRRRSRNNSDYSPRGRRNYSSDERRRRDSKLFFIFINHYYSVDTPRDRRRHSTYDSGTFNRYIYTPPNAERSVSRGRRDRRRPFTEDSIRSQTVPPNNRRRSRKKERTGVKKNKRLADIPPPPRHAHRRHQRRF